MALLIFCIASAIGPAIAQPTPDTAARMGARITLKDAIMRALTDNTGIAAAKIFVKSAAANVTQAAGAFDWNLTAGSSIDRLRLPFFTNGLRPAILHENDKQVSLGLGRTLRNGIGIDLTQVYDTEFQTATSIAPLRTVGNMSWDLSVTLPLLRGSGTAVATAPERAAGETLTGTRYTSAFQITQQVFNVVADYWNSIGQDRDVATLDQVMQQAEKTAGILKERVKGGLIAPVTYEEALADLRSREVDLSSARQSAYAARQQLAVAMGVDASKPLPVAVGPLPAPASPGRIAAASLAPLTALALDRRLDLEGLRHLVAAAKINLSLAENGLLPQLNLQLSGQYTAQRAQFRSYDLGTLYTHPIGPSVTGMLTFSVPLENDLAKGQLAAAQANLEQARLNLHDLANTTRSQVAVALDQLRNDAIAYHTAVDARDKFQNVEVETLRKLAAGEATLTDLLTVESNLITARLNVTNTEVAYATALAQLRLATGTLGEGRTENLTIDSRVFSTLPPPPAGPPR